MESHASMVPSMLFLPLDADLAHVEDPVPDRSLSLDRSRSACRFQRSLAWFVASCLLACCTYHVPTAHAVPATTSALHHHTLEDVDVLLSAMVAARVVVSWCATTSRTLSSWSCRRTDPPPQPRVSESTSSDLPRTTRRVRGNHASEATVAWEGGTI